MYDLLPEGMELISSKEQIAESLNIPQLYQGFYDIEYNQVSTKEKLIEYMEPEVVIIKNWKNTNRTMLKIIVTLKKPLYTFYQSYAAQIRFTYDYSISYDEYLDKGNVWENIVYTKFLPTQTNGHTFKTAFSSSVSSVKDNGALDKAAVDINENGNINDEYAYKKINIVMSYVVSTHQDVSKYVKTDKSNYTSKRALASPDSEYTYKLRERSGENKDRKSVV